MILGSVPLAGLALASSPAFASCSAIAVRILSSMFLQTCSLINFASFFSLVSPGAILLIFSAASLHVSSRPCEIDPGSFHWHGS